MAAIRIVYSVMGAAPHLRISRSCKLVVQCDNLGLEASLHVAGGAEPIDGFPQGSHNARTPAPLMRK